jgi:hypothetical protein
MHGDLDVCVVDAGESATDQPVEAYLENEANIPVVIS